MTHQREYVDPRTLHKAFLDAPREHTLLETLAEFMSPSVVAMFHSLSHFACEHPQQVEEARILEEALMRKTQDEYRGSGVLLLCAFGLLTDVVAAKSTRFAAAMDIENITKQLQSKANDGNEEPQQK